VPMKTLFGSSGKPARLPAARLPRDLFGEGGEVYIEDSGLLHQLATARPEAEDVQAGLEVGRGPS
jgi:hypothetical protein